MKNYHRLTLADREEISRGLVEKRVALLFKTAEKIPQKEREQLSQIQNMAGE